MPRHSMISACRLNSFLSCPPRFSHQRVLRLSPIYVCLHFQTRRAQSTSKKSNKQERPLGGKLAIITGSARGIGAAIAQNLASKGCSILINYSTKNSDDLASKLALQLGNEHFIKAVSVRGDISTEAGCQSILEVARNHFGKDNELKIDILVHNAAVARVDPLHAVKTEDFFEVYSTNVLGPILLTKACIPYLPYDRSGRIVNVSSIGASLGIAEQTVYGGSKGAVEAMTRVWARELAERATVNAVSPGPVMSRMLLETPEHILNTLTPFAEISPLAAVRADDDKEMIEYGKKFGGRPGYVSEVAGVVAMLCSADCAWTTGCVISANGGMTFSS